MRFSHASSFLNGPKSVALSALVCVIGLGSPQYSMGAISGALLVTDYGLVADGHTDNTAKWNTLLPTVPDGVEIVFPCTRSGNYYFSGQVTFASRHAYTS